MRVLVFVGCMLALEAMGASRRDKALAVRAEAQDLVDAIIRGDGNLNAALSRVHYLGAEGSVSLELAEVVRRTSDPQQLQRIAQALAVMAHANGEAALIYLLTSEDPVVRMYGARGLGQRKSQVGAPHIVPLLGDRSMGVRRDAAKALGLIHFAKAGPALMKQAKAEQELEVKVELLIAAGMSGDKKQAPALEAFLADGSESTQLAAAQGLCALGNKKGFEFAKKKLSSAQSYERLEGLKLFEGARAKEVAPVLTPLLEDKDHAVGAMAARIMYQGGDPKMLDWLVLKSFESIGEAKLPFEKELESLRLQDDQRKAILAKAGIK